MTSQVPRIALALLAFSAPAHAHPGHAAGAIHWLSGDHLAMLLALAMLAVLGIVIQARRAARIRIDNRPTSQSDRT